jgi:hypothetical protein
MIGLLLTACLVLAMFLLGASAVVAPDALMRYHRVARAFGLTEGTRRVMTRAAGAALLLLSLWFARGLFV